MANFTVVLLTAPPPGQSSEAGGALTRIDGKESLLRAAELFVTVPSVKQVLVVFTQEDADEAKKRFAAHFSFTGIKVATGGPRWLDQVAAALPKLAPETTHVILHDAARPAVPYTDIERLLEEAEKAGAVALTVPCRSTLLELDEGSNPVSYHLPNRFVQLVTPQAFDKKTFEELAATKQELHPSRIHILKASPLNIRVGGPGDEKLAKTMIGMLPKPIKQSNGPFGEAQW